MESKRPPVSQRTSCGGMRRAKRSRAASRHEVRLFPGSTHSIGGEEFELDGFGEEAGAEAIGIEEEGGGVVVGGDDEGEDFC